MFVMLRTAAGVTLTQLNPPTTKLKDNLMKNNQLQGEVSAIPSTSTPGKIDSETAFESKASIVVSDGCKPINVNDITVQVQKTDKPIDVKIIPENLFLGEMKKVEDDNEKNGTNNLTKAATVTITNARGGRIAFQFPEVPDQQSTRGWVPAKGVNLVLPDPNVHGMALKAKYTVDNPQEQRDSTTNQKWNVTVDPVAPGEEFTFDFWVHLNNGYPSQDTYQLTINAAAWLDE